MRYHHGSMDTCIRAPSSSNTHLLTQQQGQSTLDAPLHAFAIGLHLPAAIGSAIVGKFNEVTQMNLQFDEFKFNRAYRANGTYFLIFIILSPWRIM